MGTTEWNASVYHDVSNPHVVWGQAFLRELSLQGNEVSVDAGCGTGRVTELLLEQLPRGKVFAVDRSANMLDQAREHLSDRYPDRIGFVQSDLLELTTEKIGESVDLVFSTATFHWVRDHDSLFERIHSLLKPGGRLAAQCGGGPNLARLVERADKLLERPPYKTHFTEFDRPRFYADAEETAQRLKSAGFTQVETALIEAPTILPDRETYATYLTNVIYREHLSALPSEALKTALIEELTAQAEQDDPPFELDYWRLNMHARRPREGTYGAHTRVNRHTNHRWRTDRLERGLPSRSA